MEEKIPDNLQVGERIRSVRENLKMNRETFSEMIDISDVFLGQIERGERSLSLKTLCRIVSFTGVSTDFILFGDITNNSNIHKINRILSKSSESNIKYFYELINCSHVFLKAYQNDIKKTE